jgi:hypothetical protein
MSIEKNGATYLHNLTPAQLAEMLKETILSAFNELSQPPTHQTSTSQKEVLTRKETAQFFGVSLFCLHDWVNKGILTPYKVSGRTYFKRSELLTVLTKA